MVFVADLHLHSRYSMATSRELSPRKLHFWSALKGIDLVGTADYTHPKWLAELQDQLEAAEAGLFRLRSEPHRLVDEQLPPTCRLNVRFALSVEISSIYKKNGRTHQVHNLVLMPGFEAVERLNRRLGVIGSPAADGRPILRLDCRDLLDVCLSVSDEVIFIPAHIWTPHFADLGARSGFDSLEECYGDLLAYIHPVETGLSSDPPMNRRLSALDRFALVSNSDAHSAMKLGREATCFATELSYPGLRQALASEGSGEITGTIEYFPEEGKYHYDGHRKCGISQHPAQTHTTGGGCPACGRPLTVEVLHRIEELADRTPCQRQRLLALVDLISAAVGVGPKSKTVARIYDALVSQFGPELHILRSSPVEEIADAGEPLVAAALQRMRDGQLRLNPGYDGEYGEVTIFSDDERRQLRGDSH